MKIFVHIWSDIDIYAIKLLWKYVFFVLYIHYTYASYSMSKRLFVVKIVRIVIKFLQYLGQCSGGLWEVSHGIPDSALV